ncbi:cupin domain-containing protein [Halalkalibacterium halodurans]|uniref:BH0377 protein n=1 Tax=Halalkalibacterium halodurans (strain ATCC BAA-125 / DSM 18197 / FERM 7344 / JCM 9153 / C-125) TaxID=272558 RepID=Q9KFU4_HALH5|nr:cupin domain-containing protein [Halalkalibacterium halodurans]MDY7220873.1 cupin domain-containing protein [Halalkalibacterium halodurans]MDY7240112.1 cupin domain-containing protein [Halalkalibacterium halodurans]MED4125130.1 cupin domain-containing protein [Halalkalibacterium halodurans]MED4172841.1 cupin domain-containing protein [Halalkalibacterium halodurans]BAB04096.1 BH0377 [Halalkalibacterium halodurans C-125]
MKVSKANGEHYIWGDQCDGWHLVKTDELSIIHERMPPQTQEVRHYHERSRQFFFVLSGTATLEVDGEKIQIGVQEGVEVPPRVPHKMFNESSEDVHFLVTSQPNSRGDRVLCK